MAQVVTAIATEPQTAPALQPTTLLASTTPMDMISRAITQGASIDIIERLMGLHERWEATQARRAFDEAIASAKAEITPVVRNQTAHNSKKYADFAAIARMVDPIITKFGLSYRFRTTQTDRINVTCVIAHKAGHSEETTLSGPPDKTGSKNDIQAIGSTLTYLQRYSLTQALGLASADDDDGHTASKTNGLVDDEQADEISDLVIATGADITKFLAYIKAKSISDIPARDYQRAIDMLKLKQQKKAEQQKAGQQKEDKS